MAFDLSATLNSVGDFLQSGAKTYDSLMGKGIVAAPTVEPAQSTGAVKAPAATSPGTSNLTPILIVGGIVLFFLFMK